MADERDKQPEGAVKQTQNPGGPGFPDDPDQLKGEYGRNVQPDEAERAADRAFADQPVTPDEVANQSGYTGMEVDVGQQAGQAEREREGAERGNEPPGRSYPNSKP